MTQADVTGYLRALRSGDDDVVERLMPLIYGELRRIARRAMSGERGDHTLQPTALVHEAYLRLVGANVDWQDRAHFFSVAARQMRRLLVDHARRRRSQKRGGDGGTLGLTNVVPARDVDIIDLERALTKLEDVNPRQARLIELHHYGGLEHRELGCVVGVSERTVARDLRKARAFLRYLLEAGPDAPVRADAE